MAIVFERTETERRLQLLIIEYLIGILTNLEKRMIKDKEITTSIMKLVDLMKNENNIFFQLEIFEYKFRAIYNDLNEIKTYKQGQSISTKILQERKIINNLRLCLIDFIENSNLEKKITQDLITNINKNNKIPYITNIKENLSEQLNQLDIKIKASEDHTKQLEKELEENKKIAQTSEHQKIQLQEKIKKLEEETKKSKEETKKLEKATEELNKYKNETEKINKAIEKLKEPAEELKDSKKKFEENRDNYNKYAMDLFAIAKWIFILIMLNLFLFVGINDIVKSEKNLTIGFYLINIFPIIFPTVLGFLFIRQSNLNSQEVQKINKRFILIHEVNQSLQALVEVNRGKDMDNKTEKVIDRLIENILNYATEVNDLNGNKQDMNFIELNKSIDKLIDTISKKVPISNE